MTKLLEEMGELTQVIAKLMATGGDTDHWDGKGDLRDRLEEEMGDVLATLFFTMDINPEIRSHVVKQRADTKEQRFRRWHVQQSHM